jgi:hypothetical protein
VAAQDDCVVGFDWRCTGVWGGERGGKVAIVGVGVNGMCVASEVLPSS